MSTKRSGAVTAEIKEERESSMRRSVVIIVAVAKIEDGRKRGRRLRTREP